MKRREPFAIDRFPLHFFLVCLAVASLLLMTGCHRNDSETAEIVFAAGQDPSGATEFIIENFNRLHAEMKAVYQPMPSSSDLQHDAYVTYLAAGDDRIDLYALDVVWTAEFAEADWLTPLDQLPLDRSDFLPVALASATYGGELYALPWFADAGVLYYRSDLLEKYGLAVPATWDELRAAVLAVRRREQESTVGFLWQGARYEGLVCNFLEMLWSRGGSIAAEDLLGDPAGVEESIRKTLAFMTSLLDEGGPSPVGVLNYREEDSRLLFSEGKALFLRNWPYVWTLTQRPGSPTMARVGLTGLPHSAGEQGHSCLGGWNIALSRFSTHPDEAMELLVFLTGTEAMRARALRGGYVPARKSVLEDADVLRVNAHFKELKKILDEARNRPSSPQYPRLSDLIQTQVHGVLTGEITPDDAARNLVRDLPTFLAP